MRQLTYSLTNSSPKLCVNGEVVKGSPTVKIPQSKQDSYRLPSLTCMRDLYETNFVQIKDGVDKVPTPNYSINSLYNRFEIIQD